MSHRCYDIIVFGASGRIGRRICQFFYSQRVFRKWAIMGRSRTRLAGVIQMLRSGGEGSSSGREQCYPLPDLLIAEAQDFRSLRDILVETRVLLNCVRPYAVLGKEILEACITAHCDYLDLCSDSRFLESNFLEFHEEAMRKGVLIVHGCGWECLPADLGYLIASNRFAPHDCNCVESFLRVNSAAEGDDGISARKTSFHNTVRALKDTASASLRQLRRQCNERFRFRDVSHPGPPVPRRVGYFFDDRVNCFAVSALGTEIARVMQARDVNALLTGRNIWPQYHAYLLKDNHYQASRAAFYRTLFHSLSRLSIGRTMLKSLSELFCDSLLPTSGSSREDATVGVPVAADYPSAVMGDNSLLHQKQAAASQTDGSETVFATDVAGTANVAPATATDVPLDAIDEEVAVLIEKERLGGNELDSPPPTAAAGSDSHVAVAVQEAGVSGPAFQIRFVITGYKTEDDVYRFDDDVDCDNASFGYAATETYGTSEDRTQRAFAKQFQPTPRTAPASEASTESAVRYELQGEDGTNGSPMCGLFGGSYVHERGRTFYNTATSDNRNNGRARIPIEMQLEVSGPELFYDATTILVATLARFLVDDRYCSPVGAEIVVGARSTAVDTAVDPNTYHTGTSSQPLLPKGGVFTPGAAFYSAADIITERLHQSGIAMDVCSFQPLVIDESMIPSTTVVVQASHTSSATAELAVTSTTTDVMEDRILLDCATRVILDSSGGTVTAVAVGSQLDENLSDTHSDTDGAFTAMMLAEMSIEEQQLLQHLEHELIHGTGQANEQSCADNINDEHGEEEQRPKDSFLHEEESKREEIS